MRRRARSGPWLLLLLLAAPLASCDHGLTPAEARTACREDPTSQCCGSGDCALGSVCDFSLPCGLGADREVTCTPPTGDRQCHAACDAAHPCLAGQACQTVRILDGSDMAESVSFCVAAP